MNDYPTDPCPHDPAYCPHRNLSAQCAACAQVKAVPLRPDITAGVLWLWLDSIVRHYGPNVPLSVGERPLGDVKLKTNGRDTHIVVFLPVQEE